MPAQAATLINTVWPFGRQCLQFCNEFLSGAADLNVTHSQLWLELGGDDEWVDEWTPCMCPFFDDRQQDEQTRQASSTREGE